MQKTNPKRAIVKRQTQRRPGLEHKMDPHPAFAHPATGCRRLAGKRCVITGGDSGIGRAVAVDFAREGADVAIIHLRQEVKDAEFTAKVIEKEHGRQCLLVAADLAKEKNCQKAVARILKKFGRIDVLVNNAAIHYPAESITKIKTDHLLETFAVNIFSFFWMTRAAVPHMQKGGSIINTTSVTAYRGSPGLIDYSATKGAIVSFTRSLSASLVAKGIRVNAVAPGPVWTPLIVSSFDGKHVSTFGTDCPMKRPAQPAELSPAYVFLASEDASFITGQVIHVNGGEIVNG
jgi:NAD(P)-dependent dehydrogenase (short-subunit alcohol dehydrogenase family)